MSDWRVTSGKASSLVKMRSKKKKIDFLLVSAIVCPSDPLPSQLNVLHLFPDSSELLRTCLSQPDTYILQKLNNKSNSNE